MICKALLGGGRADGVPVQEPAAAAGARAVHHHGGRGAGRARDQAGGARGQLSAVSMTHRDADRIEHPECTSTRTSSTLAARKHQGTHSSKRILLVYLQSSYKTKYDL